jgi:hypothetical protein
MIKPEDLQQPGLYLVRFKDGSINAVKVFQDKGITKVQIIGAAHSFDILFFFARCLAIADGIEAVKRVNPSDI